MRRKAPTSRDRVNGGGGSAGLLWLAEVQELPALRGRFGVRSVLRRTRLVPVY